MNVTELRHQGIAQTRNAGGHHAWPSDRATCDPRGGADGSVRAHRCAHYPPRRPGICQAHTKYDPHPNNIAHGIAAQELEDFLRREHLLD